MLEQIQTWKAAYAAAERNDDKTGLHRAEQELKDAHTTRDELDLFRKNLQSFVRSYEFLSQIVDFDDRELEQLCVFARALYPLLRIENLEEDSIEVDELQLTHYRIKRRAEHRLNLAEEGADYDGLKPVSDVGSGKPHDPEKKRLSEIIEKLNDLFGAEVSDADKLHFAKGVADRIRRDEAVMSQIKSQLPEQIMYGLFPKRVTDSVLDAMSDQEKLAVQVLEDRERGRDFARLILGMLMAASGDSRTPPMPGA